MMIEHESNRKKPEKTAPRSMGSIQWLFQALSGAFIIFFLGVHLYVAHINGGSPIELFDTVVGNLRDPWWLAFFLVFLWVVTYHGLNGLKGIIYETGISAKARKVVSWALTGVFIVSIIYGTILSIVVSQMIVP